MLFSNTRYSTATFIGYIGVLFWAFSALFNVFLRDIPTFEIITAAYGIASMGIFLKVALKNEWYKFKQPLAIYLIGLLGIFGNDIFYIAAFKQLPAVQADLINYLWPIVLVVFSGFLPKEKFNLYHIFAALLAVIGTYFLLTHGSGLGGFNLHYIWGYSLAISGVAVWCFYVLVSRNFPKIPIEMVAMYCGIGAVLSLCLHYKLEPTVLPSAREWCILILMGLTSQGLAYVFWAYGIKKGNLVLLSILSYGNPILSVLLLVAFGYAGLSSSVFVASIFITLAGLVAAFDVQISQVLTKRFHLHFG